MYISCQSEETYGGCNSRMNKVTVVAVVLTFFASDFGRRHVAKAQNDTLEVIDEDFCDNCTITHSE